MLKRFIRPMLTAAVPALLFGGTASAEMLAPGGIAADLATTLDARPDFGGDLEAMTYIPFSLSDDQGQVFYLGQVVHDVVRDPANDTLSFYYRFVNAPSSAVLGVEHLMASEFKGYATEVAVLTDTTGETAPTDALRSDDGSNVTFDFDTVSSRVSPLASSFTFLVKTNATEFDDKGSASIRAFVADSTEEGSPLLAGGDASINTFRPIGTPLLIAPPPPVSVPLPPAAIAGIPTMIGSLMYVARLRKRQGHG